MADDVTQIGGSGLHRLLDDTRVVEVETPYGPPSDPVVGDVGGRAVEDRGARWLALDVVTALPTARVCACPRALDRLHRDPALP